MTSQFLHLETYGCVVSKKSKKSARSTVTGVLNEALRIRGFCPHVAKPVPAIEVYSRTTLSALGQEILRRKEASSDSRGRSIRKDALCLLAGVASLPLRSQEVLENEDLRRWAFLFADHVVNFARTKFADSLESAVVHLDEEYFHVHFYCVPQEGRGCFNMESIHPAVFARERAERFRVAARKHDFDGEEASPSDAFKEEMKRLQDEFYGNVGQHFGLERDGPRRKRLSRGEYLRTRDARDALDRENAKLRELNAQNMREINALTSELERMKADAGMHDDPRPSR